MRVVFLTFVFVLGLGAAIDAITFSRKSLREQIMSLPEPLRAVVWQSGIFGQAAACKYPEARLIGAMIPHSALVDRLSGRSREVPLLRQRLIARASTMQLAGRGQPCPVVFAALETLAASLERSVPR